MSNISERSDADLLPAYLRSLSSIPDLEPDELTRTLRELKRLRTLDPDAWQVVRDRVVRHHLRLVIRCAMRFRYGPVPLLDLIQEGNLGLMRAAEGFDVDRGVCFPTYAIWWIRRNILRALQGQGRAVHVSSYAWELAGRVRRLERERSVRCAGNLATEEIAQALKISAAQVERLRGPVAGSVSCDRRADSGEITLGETLADATAVPPDAAVAERWARRAFARGLTGIDERARQVLALRWGLGGAVPLTLVETGRRLGISRERARQIEKATLARLKHCPALRALVDFL